MRVEVDVAKYFDWQVRHKSQLEPEMVSRPAPDMGPDMHLVRVQKDEASTTRIDIPDEDIGIMHADHLQGVADAGKGGWEHPVTGEPVESRVVPTKTPKQLLAEHIEAVMAHHAQGEHITAVRVPGRPAFEAYLSARLVGGADADAIDAELLGDDEADYKAGPADDELAPAKAGKGKKA